MAVEEVAASKISFASLSNPVGWAMMGISAISSILGGRKQKKASRKAAQAQIAMGNYNANVAKRNAASQKETILHASQTQANTQAVSTLGSAALQYGF